MCIKHWYIKIGYSQEYINNTPATAYVVRRLIVFCAVVALRLLKYAGPEISYSKSNVL